MSLAILFHFLCAQHVSDINIPIIRSLRLLQAEACNTDITAPNLQHTSNQKQNSQCGNWAAQSQAPDDGYINVRNLLST